MFMALMYDNLMLMYIIYTMYFSLYYSLSLYYTCKKLGYRHKGIETHKIKSKPTWVKSIHLYQLGFQSVAHSIHVADKKRRRKRH